MQPLVDSIRQNFIPDHDITIHLFTDDIQAEYRGNDRVNIRKYLIPPYKFPQATLYRYKIFDFFAPYLQEDFLFYLDVDMRVENTVGMEICEEKKLTAVRHPGFFINGGWGSMDCSKESLAYVAPEHRKKYFAGGFQGGDVRIYRTAIKLLAYRIDTDEQKGIMAEWHDETHWNWLLNSPEQVWFDTDVLHELTPSYCMPEKEKAMAMPGRENETLVRRIVALDKNHEEMRK